MCTYMIVYVFWEAAHEIVIKALRHDIISIYFLIVIYSAMPLLATPQIEAELMMYSLADCLWFAVLSYLHTFR